VDENARLTRVRKRRWWQLSFRSILVFTAIYAVYVAALLGFWSLLGARAIFFPTLPIVIDCLLLFLLCATAAISARLAFFLEVDYDWRRGLLRLCLAGVSAVLFALPFVWAFLIACFAAALGSSAV
jgi:hypothetical protein